MYIFRLNPAQKINRFEISYNEVRDIIEQFVLCNKSSVSHNHVSSSSVSPIGKEMKNNFIPQEFFSDFFNSSQEESFLNSEKKIDRRTLKFKRTQKCQAKKREFISFGIFFCVKFYIV